MHRHFLMRAQSFIYPCLAAVMFALLLRFQLAEVFSTPIWRDDAFFASVAKNLAMGKGYSSVYYNLPLPFDGHSYSPVIILPASLMIAALGNAYWVPGLTMIMLITVLLLVLLRQLKGILPSQQRWQCAALFLMTALCVTNHEIGFPGEKLLVWHAFLGEIPSALFVIIAVLLIAKESHRPRTAFTAGIIAGLGVLCKLQAFIGAGVLGLGVVACVWPAVVRRTLSRHTAIKTVFAYGVGLLLPLLVFELTKLWALGSLQAYLETTHNLFTAVNGTSSHVDFNSILLKSFWLENYLGIYPFDAPLRFPAFQIFSVGLVIALCLLAAPVFYFLQVKRNAAPLPAHRRAAAILMLCAFAHLVWWILICSSIMERYSAQGLIYGCAGAALIVAGISTEKLRKGNILFAVIAACMLLARSDAGSYLLKSAHPSEDLVEADNVRQQLAALQKREPATLIFSCGNAFEMEYLLPGSGNFIACEHIHDPAFASDKKILLTFTIDDTHKVLNVTPDMFFVEPRYNLPAAKNACPENDLFSGRHYFISSCH